MCSPAPMVGLSRDRAHRVGSGQPLRLISTTGLPVTETVISPLAAIFLGRITRWSDPEIVRQNPDEDFYAWTMTRGAVLVDQLGYRSLPAPAAKASIERLTRKS